MKQTPVAIALFSVLVTSAASCSLPPKKPVGGSYDEATMQSLVMPPEDIPCYLGAMLCIADSKAERELLPGRVLAWAPDIGIGSGLIELYIEDGAANWLSPRMIKILRLKVSYAVPCPFAADINAWNYQDFDISEEELKGLQGSKEIASIASFSEKEEIALSYADALSRTPVVFPQELLDDLRRVFTEQEIVSIAALCAKVNYWARLIEALRIKPAGYMDDPLLRLEEFNTFRGGDGD